jgi:UDP-perosamine 4-acetyltransferase
MSTKKPSDVIIIGAGGHARVLADILRAQGALSRLRGFIDPAIPAGDTPPGWEQPVLGNDDVLPDHAGCNFIVGIGTVKGGSKLRAKLFNTAVAAGLHPVTLIHPTATIATNVGLGAGTAVMAGVIVNTDAQIGQNCILNTGCVVEHDVVLYDHVHIAPGAKISGGCQIGAHTLIGIGAILIQMQKIGESATVGAGSVVISDVASADTVVGAPARSQG